MNLTNKQTQTQTHTRARVRARTGIAPAVAETQCALFARVHYWKR